jgi:hypothetical protein
MDFDQIYLLYCSFLSTSYLFKTILTGFIILFSCMLMKYSNHIHPPSLSPLLSLFPLVSIPKQSSFFMLMSFF